MPSVPVVKVEVPSSLKVMVPSSAKVKSVKPAPKGSLETPICRLKKFPVPRGISTCPVFPSIKPERVPSTPVVLLRSIKVLAPDKGFVIIGGFDTRPGSFVRSTALAGEASPNLKVAAPLS